MQVRAAAVKVAEEVEAADWFPLRYQAEGWAG
jgi:hypothetical protein